MQEYYLICPNCNGYYKFEEGEYPQEFMVCSVCGGDLILVNDINKYYQYQYPVDRKRRHVGKMPFILIALGIIIFLVLVPGGILSSFDLHNSLEYSHSFLGSDSRGYVTKDVYSHYGSSGPKIAIITGMHPREISAKTVLPTTAKSYVLTHKNVEIVNYQINVTDSPEDYTKGRSNGEDLAAQYVVPDIEKSDYSLVIIAHNHKMSYGNGYYIATPTMDAKSVLMATSINNSLSDFNYYQRSADEKSHSTSITKVDTPIAATRTPVFVYEIPEWVGNSDVSFNSNRLIDICYHNLSKSSILTPQTLRVCWLRL